MPQAYPPNSWLMTVDRPRCPECQTRMMLARVERGPAGSHYVFECLKCDAEASADALNRQQTSVAVGGCKFRRGRLKA
jgi:hypothetical protein